MRNFGDIETQQEWTEAKEENIEQGVAEIWSPIKTEEDNSATRMADQDRQAKPQDGYPTEEQM